MTVRLCLNKNTTMESEWETYNKQGLVETYETFTKHLSPTLGNIEAFWCWFFMSEDSKKIDLFVKFMKLYFYIYSQLNECMYLYIW